MFDTSSHASSCSKSPSTSSFLISEDESSTKYKKIRHFLTRFILLPFIQGIMLGLGQHGARYFLSYLTYRKKHGSYRSNEHTSISSSSLE
jgi:hypothetical protein